MEAGEALVEIGWYTADELVRRVTAKQEREAARAEKAAMAAAEKEAANPKVTRGGSRRTRNRPQLAHTPENQPAV
jgi:hypothetical protein